MTAYTKVILSAYAKIVEGVVSLTAYAKASMAMLVKVTKSSLTRVAGGIIAPTAYARVDDVATTESVSKTSLGGGCPRRLMFNAAATTKPWPAPLTQTVPTSFVASELVVATNAVGTHRSQGSSGTVSTTSLVRANACSVVPRNAISSERPFINDIYDDPRVSAHDRAFAGRPTLTASSAHPAVVRPPVIRSRLTKHPLNHDHVGT